MITRLLFAVAGFLGLCFSLAAQETPPAGQPAALALNELGPDSLGNARSTLGKSTEILNYAYDDLPSLSLADRARFAFPSAYAWIEATPAALAPASNLQDPPRVNQPARATLAREASPRPVDLLPKFDYASSEVGVFYGKSTGKYGREVKQGYLTSEIVDGNTHISVGISYQESTRNVPRGGR